MESGALDAREAPALALRQQCCAAPCGIHVEMAAGLMSNIRNRVERIDRACLCRPRYADDRHRPDVALLQVTHGVAQQVDAHATVCIDPDRHEIVADGGFVRGRRKPECSSFEVLTGRLTAKDQASHVFAFVRNKLPDIAERLTTFVRAASGTDRPRLSVITDGSNGLQSIADRLPFSCTPVLDWFHISMRVRYLEQIVKGMRASTETEKADRRVLISRIDRLRPSQPRRPNLRSIRC